MKILKRFLLPIITGTLFLLTISVQAGTAGNWTEKFQLRGGNWILHTPTYVNLDGWMQAGRSINISAKSFNGTPLTSCGLHVKTDSTRTEFVAALICSGLYPA